MPSFSVKANYICSLHPLGYELIGVDKLPDDGPALLIYYHGAIPLDMYYILARLLLVKKRRLRNVAATFLFQIPGWYYLEILCD